ncbi:YggS family pyridoxal phosphate-dependent enzyme [Shewanella sp. D64]|uniref:YggS family pyridoxal phosphate-dependent enzyme n=1 Tax=unclassified Shewanella TaxID=196818 RepID=UPI0022BA5A89|nr:MULTISPECIES: YggS family pyridoxal phosphate-dependent enzyme [unclassified Shewanella]MEC4728237.1 YggS family pyridoxal phosphate-dependent enzyme [Shewanella sp. D64]MEC4739309.1 YggS family pyridoxal phosphate-dependent enzyme [Shewanella sp. E94]WBJ98120.1 YggS family pyridoxal phosphate-dependent enzyme [Shewanella sp. MTB7]
MTTIADRLANAQYRIDQAAQFSSRNSDEIQLLAVSKTRPNTDIIAAYTAGQRHFGENYVQEGESKIIALTSSCPEIVWHFIGPLQSNKTKVVANLFDWMHTLSRDKVAQRLSDQRPSNLAPLNICIQINISEESSKSGATAAEMLTLAASITLLPNLKLRGLMAIPTATQDIERQKNEFQKLQDLYLSLQKSYPEVDTLSMGMSNDLEQAIEHGSTMVRIGSAIFGQRDTPSI